MQARHLTNEAQFRRDPDDSFAHSNSSTMFEPLFAHIKAARAEALSLEQHGLLRDHGDIELFDNGMDSILSDILPEGMDMPEFGAAS